MITKDDIPSKKYYKIGEVCALTDIKSHTLRYWENEFKLLKPHRGNSKQRLYRRADIENIIIIKNMIENDGLTIAGVKKALAKNSGSFGSTLSDCAGFLQSVKTELIGIKRIIK